VIAAPLRVVRPVGGGVVEAVVVTVLGAVAVAVGVTLGSTISVGRSTTSGVAAHAAAPTPITNQTKSRRTHCHIIPPAPMQAHPCAQS
ncbi:MAG: hypothetical protein GYB67_15215, partial [Chloroflexi bacterium]|nr:hypothetical protein [Chloroflexota bacterium]